MILDYLIKVTLLKFKCNNRNNLLNISCVKHLLMEHFAMCNFPNTSTSRLYQVHYTGNETEAK